MTHDQDAESEETQPETATDQGPKKRAGWLKTPRPKIDGAIIRDPYEEAHIR